MTSRMWSHRPTSAFSRSAGAGMASRVFKATTLADIAQAADVPLGNVYYYFKSKDELIRAVVADYIEEVDTMLATPL